MKSIAFTTTVIDGKITIPQEYRNVFPIGCRVMVRIEELGPEVSNDGEPFDIISELTNNPIKLDTSKQILTRDEIYDRELDRESIK